MITPSPLRSHHYYYSSLHPNASVFLKRFLLSLLWLLSLSSFMKFAVATETETANNNNDIANDIHGNIRRTTAATTTENGRTPHIIGGGNAQRNEYPFMAMLVDRDRELTCGATLISPTVLLSSAHCEEGLISYAWIGRHDISISSENYQEIPVRRTKLHPRYNLDTWEYDAMIVQLEYPIDTQFQRFVQLWNAASPFVESSFVTVTAVGWGAIEMEPETYPTILQEVDLQYIPLDDCRRVRQGGFSYDDLTDDMMCTFEDGQDHCYGDSGGPILWTDDSTGTMYQIGIISFGFDCADPDFPGVATRTMSIFPFVQRHACAWDAMEDGLPDHLRCPQAQGLPPTSAPVAQPTGPEWILIELILDVWPDEISWTLRDLDTNRDVASLDEGVYFWNDEAQHPVQVVPGHSYRFTIRDTFGDGIIMSGYYQITWLATGETLVLGVGAFGSERSHVFSIPDITEAPSAAPSNKQCIDPFYPCDDDGGLPCCSETCVLGLCRHPPGRGRARPKIGRGRGGAAGRVRGDA